MRHSYLRTLLGTAGACLLGGISAFGATTTPVGAVQLDIAAGNVPVAPAFVHPDSFQGVVDGTSLSTDQLTLSFPANSFTGGEFDESAAFANYYAEVITPGDYEGMYFDIISNTTDSVVLLTWEGSPQPIIASDSIVIRKHMTVGDFFTDAEDTLLGFVDSVKLFSESGSSTLLWDGVKWTPDGVNDLSGTPIYPGQGLITTFAGPQSFVVYGSVKSTKTQVPAFNGAINLVGTMSPVDVTFADLDTISWMVAYGDSFKVWDGTLSTSTTYFSDSLKMTSDGVSDETGTILGGHTAVLLTPISDINWVQPPAYTE